MSLSAPHISKHPWLGPVLAVLAVVVLGLTLVLFPTRLNPGVPIALGGILAVITGLARLGAGTGPYAEPRSDLALAFLAWMAICTAFTIDTHLSLRSLGSMVGGTAFLVACQVGIRSREQWRQMAHALVLVCLGASVHAWWLGLTQYSGSGALRPLMGTFVNPDTFSVLPLVGLVVVLGLVEKSAPWLTWVHLLCAAFLFATLLATGCRAALVGFGLAALFLLGTLWRQRSRSIEKTKMFVGFPLVLALLFLPIFGLQSAFWGKWMKTLGADLVAQEEIRMELLTHGWKAIAHHPLVGSGPGTFGLNYQTYRPANHDTHYVDIAHNDFLEVGAETGIPGLVLWVALLVLALRGLLPLIRSGRRPTEAAAVGAGLVALAVFSLFNFIIVQRPVLWVHLWLFGLAFCFPTSRKQAKEGLARRLLSSLFLGLMGTGTVYLGWSTVMADGQILYARRAEAALNLEQAEKLYSQAIDQQPWRSSTLLAQARIVEKLQAFNGDDRQEQRLALLTAADKHSSRNLDVLLPLAQALREAERTKEAEEVFARASEVAPHHRQVFDNQLTFLIEEGQLAEAARLLATRAYRDSTYQSRFSLVLYVLEESIPGEGTEIASKWLGAHPNQRGYDQVEKVIERAKKDKKWDIEERFLKVLKQARPDDLCLENRLAAAIGRRSGPEAEFEALRRAAHDGVEKTDPCYHTLLKNLSKLAQGLNREEETVPTLRELLTLAPQQSWARITLAEILEREGDPVAAVNLLRSGLEMLPDDAELVLALAQQFERQGSRQLALNYYREALRLKPGLKDAQKKIDQLLSR
ncbi:MAG: O-antigen ligase family protein [Vulcanimicrobiota bacterium]